MFIQPLIHEWNHFARNIFRLKISRMIIGTSIFIEKGKRKIHFIFGRRMNFHYLVSGVLLATNIIMIILFWVAQVLWYCLMWSEWAINESRVLLEREKSNHETRENCVVEIVMMMMVKHSSTQRENWKKIAKLNELDNVFGSRRVSLSQFQVKKYV